MAKLSDKWLQEYKEMRKLSIDWLRGCFEQIRTDRPASKDFTLQPPNMRGVFYPNPPNCKGLRR